ncbi:MAG: peptidoglycan-binding protein [endosymbiont of Galathealinum brachiosum]|uniref:Peptidoglycan-binding protein n=1 Tax=endosymbiont of Galathealinum brachiosum TaxID=2200906 RepID=A0A370DDM1_9GAMM|nr:MAG: peptidoglycan-binding protein [endosymbiont of Galathealinum brachiosum]
MYLDHFGLLEAPFSIAPDPRYLYMSERHREALAHLLYGMESDGAFILLTGDVGTGKTTVSRCLLEQVPDDTNLALVLNPKLTSIELLQVICDELRISYEKDDLSVKSLVDYINRYLLGAHATGKKTVVLIEEAQNLDLDVLEQLRLLTNLETNERKLLQVILLGQPEFLDVLDRQELSQLAQRITARFHLTPLKLNEVEEYISHRLAVAGCRRPLFSHSVTKQLYHYSGGVPRLINVICDRALLGCFVQNHHQVDKTTLINSAREVLGDNKAQAIKEKITPRFYKLSLMIAAVVVAAVAINSYFDIQLKHPSIVSVKTDTRKELKAEPVTQVDEVKRVISPREIKPDVEQLNDQVMDSVAPVIKNEPVTQVSIQWPDSNHRLRSNLQSYQSLFKSWELDYNISTDATPCFYAETKGLSCLHGNADVDALRQLNRPAVLTFYNDLNQQQYITLTGLDDSSARIVMAGKVQIITLEQLGDYWKGEFSLLWRAPPGYQDLIMPGNAGKVVSWLSKRMNEINQNPEKTQHNYYDRELVEQVKAFQLRQGLKNDGVVGVKTLIQINHIVGLKAPLLGAG